jgi:hypothetical protein
MTVVQLLVTQRGHHLGPETRNEAADLHAASCYTGPPWYSAEQDDLCASGH